MTYKNNFIQIDVNHFDKQYFTYDTDILHVCSHACRVYRNILQLPIFKVIYKMGS